MLTYWITDEPCMLPGTATHQIGVGGFVINNNKEHYLHKLILQYAGALFLSIQVLVVKEKKCPSKSHGIWKLPTGFINKVF
ncbi:hypothetical protein ZIOFF_006032 [Zingiber officinale]|uniref:Uncharacterized protein n=1 Tax=Zingiber officinale TaxID=94328 RepID=A0A8J5HRM3_ZINOF|nr:hypothetical protein ZIOFF_006032 [Zingiber officinale]